MHDPSEVGVQDAYAAHQNRYLMCDERQQLRLVHQQLLGRYFQFHLREEIHPRLYQQLHDDQGGFNETYSYYAFPACGYTSEKEAPETCPVCGAKRKMFKKSIERNLGRGARKKYPSCTLSESIYHVQCGGKCPR